MDLSAQIAAGWERRRASAVTGQAVGKLDGPAAGTVTIEK